MRELRAGLFRRHLLVAFARLDQAQVAQVARERHLRGGDALVLQLLRQFVLGGDLLGADQLQNLALAVALASYDHLSEPLPGARQRGSDGLRAGPARNLARLHSFFGIEQRREIAR